MKLKKIIKMSPLIFSVMAIGTVGSVEIGVLSFKQGLAFALVFAILAIVAQELSQK